MENKPNEPYKHDILGILILLLIATILSTIIIVSFTDATTFDTIHYGCTVNITSTPTTDCPHAMLIAPINNSIVNTRDVTLTGYIYDNDDNIWFLTTTFYDYSTNTSISTLTSRTEYNISTVWSNLTPGETYKWYMYVENGTGNYTSGTYYFTVTSDIISGATDFYGTWILIIFIFILLILTILAKSGILAILTSILSTVITYTYSTVIMDPVILYDEIMLYLLMFITIFIWIDLFYIIFFKK